MKIIALMTILVLVAGCSDDLFILGSGCSDNETYCEDLAQLYGTTATEDLSTVLDTRSTDNQTFYENLTST